MFETIKLSQINDHIYLMDDDHNATGFIVVGSEKILVVDTMMGSEDELAIVRTISDLPVVVVNTHGHVDHILGNVYFDKCYMNPIDLPIVDELLKNPEFIKESEAHGFKMPPFEPIKGGDTIDLGNLHADIIDLPGHTAGGILVLLKEDRILFTGDGINRHLWMQLDHSLPIPELVKNLEKVMYLKDEADYILHGHTRGLDPISLMDDLLRGLKEIAEGKTENDLPYSYFNGECHCLQHPFDDKGSVIVHN